MAIDTKRTELFDQENISYEVRMYITDSGNPNYSASSGLMNGFTRDPEYIDFTNRLMYKGEDLLKRLGSITQTAETLSGTVAFTSSINSIVVNNENGFWNKPVERGIGTTYGRYYPTILKTVNNNTAYLEFTKNYTQNSWHKHKVKFVLFASNKQGQVIEEEIMVAIINDITKDSVNNTATISLWNISMPLKKLDISTVRDGLSWWNNKPISFLVRKILEKEYGIIPSNFVLPDRIEIPTSERLARKSTEARALTAFGSPPEYDITTIGSEVWQNLGLTCRATAKWQWNETGGNASKLTDGVVVSVDNAFSVTCETGFGDSGLIPKIGDALNILQDDVTGNTGVYTINEIDNTSFTLNTPVNGSATAVKLPFVINRIYMGCDDQLWEYLPDRDSYKLIDDTTLAAVTDVTGASDVNYEIKRLWFNPNDNCIWGAAWQPPSAYGFTDIDNVIVPDSRKDVIVQVFKYDGTTFSIEAALENVFIGDFAYRDAKMYQDNVRGSGNSWYFGEIGLPYGISLATNPNYYDDPANNHAYDENLVLPFRQSILPVNVMGWDGDGSSAVRNGIGQMQPTPTTTEWGEFGYNVALTTPLLSHTFYGSWATHFVDENSENAGDTFNSLWDEVYSITNPSSTNVDLPADYYSIYLTGTDTIGIEPGKTWLRHSYGQEGFFVFNKENATRINGVIWYFTIEFDATYPDGDMRLNSIDLSNNSETVHTDNFAGTPSGSWLNVAGTGRIYLSGVESSHVDWTEEFTSVHQPLCGCVPPNGEEGVMFSLLFWSSREAVIRSYSGSPNYIVESTGPTGLVTISKYSADTAAERKNILQTQPRSDNDSKGSFAIPLNMTPVDEESERIILSLFYRNKLGTTEAYGVHRLLVTGVSTVLGSGQIDSPIPLSHQPMYLTTDTETRTETYSASDAGEIVYFIEGGTGVLKSVPFDFGTALTSVTKYDLGAPIVNGEVYEGSNLIVDKITRIRSENTTLNLNNRVWGVSQNSPNKDQALNIGASKKNLWKFDEYLNDRIELAKFEGMYAWDALAKFAQISDHVIGFEGDAFYFIPRILDGPSQFEFKNDGDVSRYSKIVISENRKEIYNKVEIVPSIVTLVQPSWKMELVIRSGDLADPDIDIILDQKDTLTKTIELTCVVGGMITQGQDDAEYEGSLNEGIWFRYFVYDRLIETTLASALENPIDADKIITLTEGLNDIDVNDTLKLYTVFGGIEYVAVYNIDSVNITLSQVTCTFNTELSTVGLGNTIKFALHSTVIIEKNKEWTDEDNLLQINTYGDFFAIGSTNINIKFINDADTTSVFIAGDTIKIDAPGLKLEKSEPTRQIAVNMESVFQYQKNLYPSIDNPFMNFKTAREVVEKILYGYADPHYGHTLYTKLYPFIKFITNGRFMSLFNIVSPYLFPMSSNYTRTGSLKSISHNFDNKTSTFIFRDTKPY